MVGEEIALPKDTVLNHDGQRYEITVRGSPISDGNWLGWIEFASKGDPRVLRTDRETTQPNRDALMYWASGLEPLYFEGAFTRAR